MPRDGALASFPEGAEHGGRRAPVLRKRHLPAVPLVLYPESVWNQMLDSLRARLQLLELLGN